MPPVRNLVNLNQVSKGFAAREVLSEITLGVSDGDRIGIVGRNGQGKSTLVDLICGAEEPDSGQLVRVNGLTIGSLSQDDGSWQDLTIHQALLAVRPEHEWTANRYAREVLTGLLGGPGFERFAAGSGTLVSSLSGGERRRIALAQVLFGEADLLLLDEPTNHLDLDVIAWLATHLSARSGAMLVVTHDRWFLDAVCTRTWEVAGKAVHQYEGGYAAYVLARAERERQLATQQSKREQLLRKELAWLRRGPPARTSKPRFRIDAANTLIADEPPARDTTELLRFASSRLGQKVIEAEDLSYAYGGADARPVIDDVTWLLGPGDRLALVGANGSGKSTLLRLLAGELTPVTGTVTHGQTVRLAHLSQEAAEISPELNVLEAVEEIGKRAVLSSGEELTAGKLAERFGFRGEGLRTRVGELSGGERRRLTLMRLLMGEPNVLLLDEPTNDLDIDTLTALEDLLDGWPGTLLIISHDRYFTERVCDNVFCLDQGHHLRHLPGGIDQYLQQNLAQAAAPAGRKPAAAQAPSPGEQARLSGGEIRELKKEVQRLEREITRLTGRAATLHDQMAAAATDHVRLAELTATLTQTDQQREQLELEWMQASERLED